MKNWNIFKGFYNTTLAFIVEKISQWNEVKNCRFGIEVVEFV